MQKRYAIPLYAVCFILQISFLGALPVHRVSPDLMLILSVLLPLCFGGYEGCYLGFAFGILRDMFFSAIIGPSAILYLAIAFALSKLRYVFYSEKALTVPLILLVSTAIHAFGTWGIWRLLGEPYGFRLLLDRLPWMCALELVWGMLLYFLVGRKAYRFPQDRRVKLRF